MNILDGFDLGINYDKFFSPIRKTDNLEFDDFCCLFSSTPENQEIFRKTLGKGFEESKGEDGPRKNYPFPIIIVKKK